MRHDLLRLLLITLALLVCAGVADTKSRPVTIPGSTWVMPVKVRYEIEKIGKFGWNEVDTSLSFGPQSGLASNAYTWLIDGLESTDGLDSTYKVDKNKVKLNIDKAKLIAIIKENLQTAADELLDVELSGLGVTITKIKELNCESGRDRRGAYLSLKATVEFSYSCTVEGRKYKGKGKLGISGVGR